MRRCEVGWGEVRRGEVVFHEDEAERAVVAAAMLKQNGKVKIVAARCGGLQGDERAAGRLEILAGPQRRPLMTTHAEFGVRYVIDLEGAFFSPRMGPERFVM